MTPCIDWTGTRDRDGYGKKWHAGGVRYAHRVAYEGAKGPIPAGLVIDHLCRNRACVNPDHLEAVTQAENSRRGAYAMKTHCVNGHAFDTQNTYRTSTGTRSCRKCNFLAVQRLKRRRQSSLEVA